MKSEIQDILTKVAEKKLSGEEGHRLIEQLKKAGTGSRDNNGTNDTFPGGIFSRHFLFDEPLLKDHTVFGEQVLLGVTYCSLAVEAARSLYPNREIRRLRKLLFIEPIILYPGEKVDVEVILEERPGQIVLKNRYKKSNQQEYHDAASGELLPGTGPDPGAPIDIKEFQNQCEKKLPGEQVYRELGSIVHGPSLRTVQHVFILGQEVLAELSLSREIIDSTEPYELHPALLDGAVVSSTAALAGETGGSFVPMMIKEINIFEKLPQHCFCHSRVVKHNPEVLIVDIRICDEKGSVLLSLEGFTCKRVSSQEIFGVKGDQAPSPPKPKEIARTELPEKPAPTASVGGNTNPPGKRIEEYITRKLSAKLGGKRKILDKNKNFMDLGIDSNALVSLSQEMEHDLAIELYPTLFFEYQNISELSRYFAEEFASQFSVFFNLDSRQETVETGLKEEEISRLEPARDIAPVNEKIKPGGITPGSSTNDKDIAVIGMAGIFAESPDVDTFWRNLREKKDLMKEIPPDHFDYQPWFDPEPAPGKAYCKWGSFIDEIDKFDAAFFGISPREAEVMDPQLRHLLQILYSAAEDAGYAPSIRGSRTGMFVGVCFYDYMQEMGRLGVISPYTGTGNVATMISNRPSFCFDLKGPSLSVDTACSSSLVALHLACKSLARGECDMAFTAGTNLLLSSNHYVYFSSIRALSFSGRCHTFDKRADGYVPGEAVGAVLLKPLSKALSDHDRIYAVIKGSAINHGGYSSTITAPNPALEARVIMDAWQDAGLDPETLGYIEAHGTGTKLGDPIEIDGLRKAFKKFTNKEQFCTLGSAKAHIGHAEGAAGIAGLIKVILSMKNGEIPPMPKFEELNPLIKLEGTPLFINREVQKWNRIDGHPRRAGISSFGFGGAYAHAVVEEYDPPPPQTREKTQPPYIFVLSARNESRLKTYARVMIDYLEKTARPGPEPGTPGSEENLFPGIQKNLLALAGKILEIDEKNIDVSEDLREYGFDITTLADFASRINDTYDIGMTSSIFSEHSTIESLAQYTAASQKDKTHQPDLMEPGHSTPSAPVNLADITYSLQVGREVMEERLAVTAAGTEELINRLTRYVQGNQEVDEITGLYHGNDMTDKPGSDLPPEGTGREDFIRTAVKNREFTKLARLWVSGVNIDWNLLYPSSKPARVSLPTYPFEKKSYWFDSYKKKSAKDTVEAKEAKPVTRKTSREFASPTRQPKVKAIQGWNLDPRSYKGDEVALKILDKHIALVVMQDKKNKNVFTEEVGIGLAAKISQIRQDENIKVAIITGYDNVFCMGGTKDILDNISRQKNTCADMSFVYSGLLECEVPVISAIQGHAVGGGLVFGLFGDIVVMAEEGIYSSNFMKYGFTPGVGATFILKERLGGSLATELMFTASSYSGEDLKQRGAPFIFKKGNEVLNEAIKIARQLIEKPLHSLKVLKTELASRLLEQLPAIIEREIDMHHRTVSHPEVKRNIQYYFGKSTGLDKPTGTGVIPKEAGSSSGKITLKSKAKEEIRAVPVNISTPGHDVLPEDEQSIKNKVSDILCKILHMPENEINTEAIFNDLGVDSIGGVEIVRDINRTFQLNLDAVILYDHPTITKLSHFIHQELKKTGQILNQDKKATPTVPAIRVDTREPGEEPGGDREKTSAAPPALDLNEGVVRESEDSGDYDRTEELDIEDTKEKVTGIVCDILHFPPDEINTEASLNDLGVDSIGGVEIVRDINKTFGLNLDAVVLYDYSTISRLSGKVYQETMKNKPIGPGAGKPVKAAEPGKPVKPGEPVPIPVKVELKQAGTAVVDHIQGPVGKLVLKDKRVLHPGEEKEVGKRTEIKKRPLAREEEGGSREERRRNSLDIAIIGMSGRFAGARDIDELWHNLSNGIDSVTEVPRERWDIDRYYDPDPQVPNKTYCRWGGFLEDADKFDPLFFNISPLEAEIMDPQQRLFLEEAWRALESTGYPTVWFSKKKCGVFVGVAHGDYTTQSPGSNLNTQLLMGSSISILSARISYFLDLTGPNLALDTACSSSLVAIHQACQSIINGESDVALAGGVCVLAGPNLHIMAGKSDMLSRDEKCKTFDNSADGFVPAEGVGVVVLKPLERAIEDNDTIWGVIKASAINQDGKTNGITAPSANSQYRLETQVYRKFNIDPTTISYIEAHGTGTKLGDPIEITALNRSFREFTDKNQYCPIGSVKTNIGHALTAAGAASLIKVLLCFKNKKLVPSLHFKDENEHIRFKETPFYVNTELKEWKSSNSIPRRAAISSFGFSGTNCHMVVEEPPAGLINRIDGSRKPYYFIPLSAKSRESLEQKARNLITWLENNGTGYAPGDVAYTLLTGRSHFYFRSALVVRDTHQLMEKLKTIRQEGTAADYFTNERDEKPTSIEPALKNLGKEILKELTGIKTLTEGEYKEKLLTLADLYVKGYDLEWKNLYRGESYRRILLPTYPFDRQSYWYSPGQEKGAVEVPGPGTLPGGSAALHPLLDVNQSTLAEETFKKTLKQADFYLKDHVVAGNILLPGVAYLEMARAAGELASGQPVKAIKDVIWAQPMVLDNPQKDIHIGIYPGKDSELFYEAYGIEAGERRVYSHGKMLLSNGTPDEPPPTVKQYDLESIKKRCPVKIQAGEIYRHYKNHGFEYGPGFQVTQELFCGEREALARIKLPGNLLKDFPGYGLHPSLMDGALRIIMKIGNINSHEELPLQLPFALGSLELIKSLPGVCYSYAAVSPGNENTGISTRKYNISILDETGRELLRALDFSSRVVKTGAIPVEIPTKKQHRELIYYQAGWDETPGIEKFDALEDKNTKALESIKAIVVFDRQEKIYTELKTIIDGSLHLPVPLVLVKPADAYKSLKPHQFQVNPGKYNDYEQLFQALKEQGILPGHILHLWNLEESGAGKDFDRLAANLDTGLYSMMNIFKAVTDLKLESKTRCIFGFPGTGDRVLPEFEAISGFANALTTVNHRFELIGARLNPQDIDPRQISQYLIHELIASDNVNGTQIRYMNNQRLIRHIRLLEESSLEKTAQDISLKPGGVYLITGGAGGLGMIFARFLAENYQARLVLMGRSKDNQNIRQKIKEIQRLGGEAIYLQADVSKPGEVKEIVKTCKERFQGLNGIIHSAGIGKAPPITEIDKPGFEQVLLPKIHGTINLDLATRDEKLDFFVLFSSIAAILGDFGLCSYASANSFMDSYADLREQSRRNGKRSGKTLSVNWPFWEQGEMALPEEEASIYFKYSGMKPLGTKPGLEAFKRVLGLDLSRVIIASGDQDKISRVLNKEVSQVGDSLEDIEDIVGTVNLESRSDRLPEQEKTGELSPAPGLFQETERYLKETLAKAIKLPVQKIDSRVPLENYGISSVMIMDLNNLLEKDFESLPKTLFFEYSNLYDLTGYFVTHQTRRLKELFNLDRQETAAVSPEVPTGEKRKPDQAVPGPDRRRFSHYPGVEVPGPRVWQTDKEAGGDIAIIGASGRYPMARNLEEFWENLKSGKDCIVEIPRERWDYQLYYDPAPMKKGKMYCKWGSFIDDVDKFDPLFFNISPREAEVIDPQERLFLEIAWSAIEDAGYTREQLIKSAKHLKGSAVGIFAGVMWGNYRLFGGNSDYSAISNRVSYWLNAHGPSMTIDTACSSSLMAIHLACESLKKGECRYAIAGGVNLSIHPLKYINLCQANILSTDGRCRSFGAGGDGYVPGEGVGALLLKPLEQAQADGDHIYAVIKGSATNHGGKTNGYYVPNPNAQADVIHQALQKTKINPRTISYIETHGTGTVLGDPIEITGMTKTFEKYTLDKQYCSIGSVKSNVGHLEGAAGIVGITKVILQMKHRQLVPSIHSRPLNPNIDFAVSPFYVQQELGEWPRPIIKENGIEREYPRRAGFSAFGAGGTNVHLIVEEYTAAPAPRQEKPIDTGRPGLILLSARNTERLKAYARGIAKFLNPAGDVNSVSRGNDNPNLQTIEKEITRLAADIITVKQKDIDVTVQWEDYGFDLVSLNELAHRVNEQYNLKIEPDIFIEYSTLASFARYISREYGKSSIENATSSSSPRLVPLEDMAYTLQIGREPLVERLAMIVSSTEELGDKLEDYCRETPGKDIENIYTGNIKNNQTKTDSLVDGEEGAVFVKTLLANRRLDKLAQLWINGVQIDWQLLYRDKSPARISLPTYPFSKESYWLPKGDDVIDITDKPHDPADQVTALHPLIHSNTSTLQVQRFTTWFTGNEFYLTDHVVGSHKVLPGVVYLEMVRAAGELSSEKRITTIKNIVWLKPIMVDRGSYQVHICLYPHNEDIEFQVTAMGDNNRQIVHAQGWLVPGNDSHDSPASVPPGPSRIDIDAVKRRCPDQKSGTECYQVLTAAGLNYGPSFQTIRELYSNGTEVISRVQLAPRQQERRNEFLLHPALMDGAFTSIMGLFARVNLEEGQTYLPFELGELQILKPLPEICYVIAAFSDPRQTQDRWPKKVDIKITNESGEILVDIKDLAVRLLEMPGREPREESPLKKFHEDETEIPGTLYFRQEWKQSRTGVDPTGSEPGKSLDSILIFDTDAERFEILNHRLSPGKSDRDEGQCILVIPGKSYRHPAHRVFEINPVNPGDWGQLVEALLEQKITSLAIAHLWSWARPADDSLAEHLDKGVYSLFYLSQELVKRKFPGTLRLLYLYEGAGREELPPVSQALHGAVGGFANSIRQEQPKFVYKTVEIGSPTLENPKIIDLLLEEFQRDSNLETEIRYEAGTRYLMCWQEFEPDSLKAGREGLLKDKGVYIITGGTGSLGLIIAEYLAREFKAGLVLAGRSGLSPGKQRKIDALQALGAEVIYSRADISNPGDAKRVVQETRSRFGRVNGVLHCAGVVRDSLLDKKTRQEMEEVLAPKVYGTFYLDEATKNDPLDFFVMFSSTAVMGNRGQIDYAYGNCFLDKFIQGRERLRLQGKRAGKTLSINWPYWKEGGMKVDEQTEKLLKTLWGMRPLPTPTGLEIFSRGLTLDLEHFMVIAGHRPKVLRAMGLEAKPERDEAVSPPVSPVDTTTLAKQVEQDIVKMISAILKIKESNIGLNDDLKEFGFDSISLTELANKLNDLYTLELTPTVFFELEQPTIAGVARFLCRNHTGNLGRHYSRGIPSPPMELETGTGDAGVSVEAEVREPRSRDRFQARPTREIPPGTAAGKPGLSPEPMAIIGMSGVMPHSKNLDIFWKHLEEGRDLISEIPIDRWDWRTVSGENGEIPASKWGSFIDDVDKFDALFFGISRREAEIMDPQQRLFMAAVWKSIEDAGYRASDLSGSKTGLFVGAATMDYADLVKAHFQDMDAHMATGMTHSVLANRISYFMNWHGPSEPVDTACSSSLVALHRAIGAIRAGDCDRALVGGVNIMLTPSLFTAFARAGMLSEDGRCKTFDKRANGYVRGEGAAAIFIKPLGKAEADGDHIYAVIKASAVNHGGHATSLTAPNSNAQAELLITAYEKAQVDPTTVTYIEAHGTGTTIGDPIEIDGLKKAFTELYRRKGLSFPDKPHCGLTSVKTNIGHLETAAGIAGLVKVLLSMKYKKLPKNVHFKDLNPYIDLKNTPFFIARDTQPWECLKDENNREIPRLAGVSSFGFGGVNSHVVLEEYRGSPPVSPHQGPWLLVFSAKDKDRLYEYVEEITGFLEQNLAELNLTDIAYTMQMGREEFEERLALVASAKEQLLESLKDYCRGNVNHQEVYEGNIEIDNKIPGLLMDEAESGEWLKSITAARKLDKLAQLWVSGVKIDWKLLYNQPVPRRISMPTYPFARQRYWIPGPGPGAGIEAPGVQHPPGKIQQDMVPEKKQAPGENRQTPTQVQGEPAGILPQIKQAGFGQRQDLLVTYLKSRISELLRMDLAKIGENRSLEQFGFDSILVLQLKNKINVELDIDVPIEKFVGNVNIQKISDLLLVKMALADIITVYDPGLETDEEMEELVI